MKCVTCNTIQCDLSSMYKYFMNIYSIENNSLIIAYPLLQLFFGVQFIHAIVNQPNTHYSLQFVFIFVVPANPIDRRCYYHCNNNHLEVFFFLRFFFLLVFFFSVECVESYRHLIFHSFWLFYYITLDILLFTLPPSTVQPLSVSICFHS